MIKLGLVAIKTASRPVNNVLKRVIANRGKNSFLHSTLVKCGQLAHRYEIKVNRYIVNEKPYKPNTLPGEVDEQDIKVYIKPLSDSAAFNKGVEYFTEIVFFYAVLMLIAIYELRKNEEIKRKLKENLSSLK